MLVTLRGERVNQVIYPFIPKISLSILLTVFQTILMMLIWRICHMMNFILITCLLDIVLIL